MAWSPLPFVRWSTAKLGREITVASLWQATVVTRRAGLSMNQVRWKRRVKLRMNNALTKKEHPPTGVSDAATSLDATKRSFSKIHQAMLHGISDKFSVGLHLHFQQQPRSISADSFNAQSHFFGNLTNRFPLRDLSQDLELALR